MTPLRIEDFEQFKRIFDYQSSMENDAPHEHPDSDKGFEDTTKDFLINSCLKSIVDPSMSSILSLSVTKLTIYVS